MLVTSVATERTHVRFVFHLRVFLDVSAEVVAVQQWFIAVLARKVFPASCRYSNT